MADMRIQTNAKRQFDLGSYVGRPNIVGGGFDAGRESDVRR